MTAVIILVLLGILLFVIEFLLVPGVTVAGIGGLVLTVIGVYKAFADFGSATGYWVLAATLFLSLAVIVFALRAKTWNRLTLKTKVEGSVGDYEKEDLKVGDQGEALTRLAPMGKVRIKDQVREASSEEGYIDEHSSVEISMIDAGKIFVKTK